MVNDLEDLCICNDYLADHSSTEPVHYFVFAHRDGDLNGCGCGMIDGCQTDWFGCF